MADRELKHESHGAHCLVWYLALKPPLEHSHIVSILHSQLNCLVETPVTETLIQGRPLELVACPRAPRSLVRRRSRGSTGYPRPREMRRSCVPRAVAQPRADGRADARQFHLSSLEGTKSTGASISDATVPRRNSKSKCVQ